MYIPVQLITLFLLLYAGMTDLWWAALCTPSCQ
jgi:hypothetical protein